MRISIIIITILLLSSTGFSQLYKTSTGMVKFFSETPLENIEAINNEVTTILKLSTKVLVVGIPVIKFHFEKPLMEEHFNENYMETSKFMTAKFMGKIEGDIDLTKDGTHEITVKGDLTIHGVKKPYTLTGTIKIDGKSIITDTKFKVKLADHDIKIPSVVMKNIAEVVEVTSHFEYQPK